MTTLWKPTRDWEGATVAVLGSAASMNAEVAESLRAHRCIAVNHTHVLAPWADMLVALDGAWPQAFRDFAGMRVTGIADDSLDALYPGPMYERVTLAPNWQVEIHNSGLAAIRIAAAMGAARIILAGFNPAAGGHWYYDDEVDIGDYQGVDRGLLAIVAELTAQGIVVERLGVVQTSVRAHPAPSTGTANV